MAESELYTAGELLEAASRLGLRATRRLITDWVELGLLDEPRRRSLGRAKGSAPGVWPRNQVELFIDLLTLRQRPANRVTHISPLANLPVIGWLWQYPDVPLRQVRRAMATWAGRHRVKRSPSADDARRTARRFVAMVEHSHATLQSRNRLRRYVEQSLREQTFDLPTFRDAVKSVFDPHDEQRTAGPKDVPLHVDLFVRLAQARFTAIAALDGMTDQHYEDARLIYMQTRREYLQQQPDLSRDQQFGCLFKEPTFEDVIDKACVDLLTILGMGLLSPESHQQIAASARAALAPA